MKKRQNLTQTLSTLIAAVSSAAILTACGGSGPEPSASSQSGMIKTTAAMSVQGQGVQPGLNSSSPKYEGFNPSIWNEHKWYECNCGINPNTPPSEKPQGGLLLGNQV